MNGKVVWAGKREPSRPVSRVLSAHSQVDLWTFTHNFPEWKIRPLALTFKFESQTIDAQMGQPWVAQGYSQKVKMTVFDVTLHDKIAPSYMVLHVREHEDYIPVEQVKYTGFPRVSEESLARAHKLLRDTLISIPEGPEREVHMEGYVEALGRVDVPGGGRMSKYTMPWRGYLGPTFYVPRRIADELDREQKGMLESFAKPK